MIKHIQLFIYTFHQKIKSVQYNSAKEKLYQQLGLETPENKKMLQETVLLFKNIQKPISEISISIIPIPVRPYNAKNDKNIS